MKPFEISDETRYVVNVAVPVDHENRKLLPRDKHKMQGAVLRSIVEVHGWEAIVDANAIG